MLGAGIDRCIKVYACAMGRTNVVVDDELVEKAKRLYGLRTVREVIDLALRRLVGGVRDPWRAALELEDTGWEGDLDEMRVDRIVDL